MIGTQSAVVRAAFVYFSAELERDGARLVVPLLIEIPLGIGRNDYFPLFAIVATTGTSFAQNHFAVGQVYLTVNDVLALWAHRSRELMEHRISGLHDPLWSWRVGRITIYSHSAPLPFLSIFPLVSATLS